MRARFERLLSMAIVAALAACGSDPQPEPPATAATETAPAVVPSEAIAEAHPPMDLAAVDLCQLVTVHEVASTAGGKPATEPSWNGKACFYVVETASDTESYLAALYPASTARVLLDVMSPEEKGEKIDGPWSEAWLGPRISGTGFTLHALLDDARALEISGDRREVVLSVANLMAERLQ